MILLILLLIICIGFSALLSSSEVALFSLPKSVVRKWQQSAGKNKRIAAELLSRPQELLVLIFMLNTAANIAIQNTASTIFETQQSDLFGKIVFPIVVILLLGELTPKWLGIKYNQPLSKYIAPAYLLLGKICAPIQKIMLVVSELLSRLFFFFLKPEPPLEAAEIAEIVQEAAADGALDPHEATIITQWIALESKSAVDIMTPRSSVPIFSKKPLKELREEVLKKATTADEPLHFNGILVGERPGDHPEATPDTPDAFIPFEAFFLPESTETHLFYAPETIKIKQLLHLFEQRPRSIAALVDEYGSASGYLTEQAIFDRLAPKTDAITQRDASSGAHLVNDRCLIAPGTMLIESVNDFFKANLKSRFRSVTIAGWLIEEFDCIPKTGTKYEKQGFVFRILKSSERRIDKIFIQKQAPDSLKSAKRIQKRGKKEA